MDTTLDVTEVNRLAAAELNLLHMARVLPGETLEGANLGVGTVIYDLNGSVLFHRIALERDGEPVGYADVAAHTAFGSPLLAVAPDAVWNERQIQEDALEALSQRSSGRDDKDKDRHAPLDFDAMRFVAYSYPKIAIQFLRDGKEVLMLECFSWTPVPPAPRKREAQAPGNFERWSLLDEMPERQQTGNHERFEQRYNVLSAHTFESVRDGLLVKDLLRNVAIQWTRTREIHYSGRNSDHHVCYELRGQETNVWCVAASTQMLLDFYRYNYTQTRIADRLGLGTPAHPNGLPYGDEGKVVTQLNLMSNKALTASMNASPSFSTFTGQIDQNRPLISFIPGHSRTVAGYTESWLLIVLFGHGFRGLLVYDPWPPNAGVITRWENFDTQTYRHAFSAHVTTI